MNKTDKYYKKNCEKYIASTSLLDMNTQYDFFLKHFKGTKILDIGFGSGRDLKFFSQYYDVLGIDVIDEFVLRCKNYNVLKLSVLDMEFENSFDGIWACASLLHIESKNLNSAFKNISRALKDNGILYCSFKYGDFQGLRDNRYYIDLTEESILNYLKDTSLKIIDTLISVDVRNDSNQKWLNVIMKKEK